MQSEFDYLIDKISKADFSLTPFRHVYLEDLFSPEHFNALVKSDEINIPAAKCDRSLCDHLTEKGWTPVKFPGGTTSISDYLKWRSGRASFDNVETCEGFGIVFRLEKPDSNILIRLNSFLKSEAFLQALADKFNISRCDVVPDVGIQKYLDGYEISPHPDIRIKALTFMVNINPYLLSEKMEHHTHYLKFKDQWSYVEQFWKHNEGIERAWVPWEWCNTEKQQTKNNSIVIFSPSNDTMHAVKANYNHLVGQRTQLYGNLWYGSDMNVVFDRKLPQIPWQGLSIDVSKGDRMVRTGSNGIGSKLRKLIHK